MRIARFARSSASALAIALASAAASASPEAWEQADAAYQAHHFGAALEIYQRMALAGDARAAELAGHMLAIGEKLYGDAVRRDPARALELLGQAAQAGRPVAGYLLRTAFPARPNETNERK